MPTRLTIEIETAPTLHVDRRAAAPPRARCRLPGFDLCELISVQILILGLDSIRIGADATLLVGNSGPLHEPAANRIAPHLGVPGLEFEPLEHFTESFVIDLPFERPPLVDQRGGLFRSVVMRVVEVLNDRLTGVQFVACRARDA